MTITRETAQQAIDALIPLGNAHFSCERDLLTSEDSRAAQSAIAALKAELDAPESPRGTDAQILKERELTASAIRGAMAFGYQGVNPPPETEEDHWLAEFWEIGRQLAAPVAAPVVPPPHTITQRDFDALLEVAQHLRDLPHWQAQASSRLIAEILQRSLAAAAPIAAQAGAEPRNLQLERGFAFQRIMGDPSMPKDLSDPSGYDEWLFGKAWAAGVAAAQGEIEQPQSGSDHSMVGDLPPFPAVRTGLSGGQA